MNLFANHRCSYFEAKTSFLIPLNFYCHKLKRIERNSDVYKLMARDNSLVPHLRAFAIRRTLQLTM